VDGVTLNDTANQDCLQALLLTNPQDVKQEIEQSHSQNDRPSWLLDDNLTFLKWQHRVAHPVLWIHGMPSVSTTLITTDIVNFLLSDDGQSPHTAVAYFFCGLVNSRQSPIVDMLRAILYQVLRRQPTLFKHIRKTYDVHLEKLFTSVDALQNLWSILCNMLNDKALNKAYIVIDGLEECDTDSLNLFLALWRHTIGSSRPMMDHLLTHKWLFLTRDEHTLVPYLKKFPNIDLGERHLGLASTHEDHVLSKTNEAHSGKCLQF
jgi:hypothetical protein